MSEVFFPCESTHWVYNGKKKKKKGGWGHLKKQNARVTNYFKIVVQFFNVPIWHGRESEGHWKKPSSFNFTHIFFIIKRVPVMLQ
jgi:hypothetical protein